MSEFNLTEYLIKNKINYSVSSKGHITVGGSLDLRGTNITSLPDNLTVGGSLDLRGTNITSLPDNLTVGGSLDLEGTNITSLPDNLTVGGSLDLEGTNITSLPDNLTVGDILYLRCTNITSLPDNLTVGGSLDLEGTNITSLPDNLTVGVNLDLEGTNITSLPDNLTVGGSLYLRGTNINQPTPIKIISRQEVKFIIEKKLNKKGYTIADGILAKVVHKKVNISKILIVGRKETSFLVTDGNGNYSHGETIKKAQEDLIYKKIATFDGELPTEAKGTEWIGIYRAVTGACSLGVKEFVNRSGKDVYNYYTCKEICELVKNEYGGDIFIEKANKN